VPLAAVHLCFDNWRGIGDIVAGVAREGYNLELRRDNGRGWRAIFRYAAGRSTRHWRRSEGDSHGQDGEQSGKRRDDGTGGQRRGGSVVNDVFDCSCGDTGAVDERE
jgi:hypothetical protein